MAALPKQYQPHEYEESIYARWEKSGAFAPGPPQPDGRPPFVIMLPPPNITGSLHIGHALQDTIMDILIRYHRMLGEETLWLPGTDSAAIATNRVLEEQLLQQGKTSRDLGREEFLKLAGEWYQKTGSAILRQMKRLGCSCDWSRERFTMDEQYLAAVNEAFLRYYEKGYIYRGSRIVNWDPYTQTTVSDLEVERQAATAPLYTLQYGPFQISTARPETKFGDKYVVVHPDDARYQRYQPGETFEAAWINGTVTATVIKDDAIDPAFGTGAMTITPWHDPADFAIAERHGLDKQQIIGFDGRLLPIAGEFAGLTVEEARPRIVAKLQAQGLLVSVDENYQHSAAVNERGKAVIEPQIMRQWFVDMSKLKNKAIEAAVSEEVQFMPPRWKKHFITWLEGVYDWNINRQIWLGHRLPVWWKKGTHGTDNEEGSYVVSIEKPAGDEWEQDPDVLDTWFATALWPFAALGWPRGREAPLRGKPTDLDLFYPTSVLVTARDILYLWVARMVFSGLEFMQDVPFRAVLIHPTVLAKDGRRMSKSLGTGVDPLGLIEKYGADATRFGLMHQLAYDSQALKFDEEAIKSARNFTNKIWNIARLLQSLPEGVKNPKPKVPDTLSIADTWIEERLAAVASEVTALLDQYKIGEAARSLHAFLWNDFADWYLEIVKITGSPASARRVFLEALRLLHPFMPHLTEVLWQKFEQPGLLMTASWPTAGKTPGVNGKTPGVEEAVVAINRFQDIVTASRRAQSLFQLPPGSPITLAVAEPPLPAAISALCRAEVVPAVATGMVELPLSGGGTIAIGAAGLTAAAISQAKAKLILQADELEGLIAQTENSLAKMRGKAPQEIVAAREELLAASHATLRQLKRSEQLLGGASNSGEL